MAKKFVKKFLDVIENQSVSEIFPGAIVEISFAKPIDKNNHNQLAKVKKKTN